MYIYIYTHILIHAFTHIHINMEDPPRGLAPSDEEGAPLYTTFHIYIYL